MLVEIFAISWVVVELSYLKCSGLTPGGTIYFIKYMLIECPCYFIGFKQRIEQAMVY
jgi:hypothetical protein